MHSINAVPRSPRCARRPARARLAPLATVLLMAAAGALGAQTRSTDSTRGSAGGAPASSYVQSTSDVAAGEYLTIVGGCNDCHTAGWAESNGKTPAAERLAGSDMGYRGPWGTSYAANLRRVTQRQTEDQWVRVLTTADGGHGRPPMPWMNTALTSDRDLRAMYRYIRSLGPRGEAMPRAVAPGIVPTTPYIDFVPVVPKKP
jgi:mono/diheme cytochrome c family protein